jgi:hypothetical protein
VSCFQIDRKSFAGTPSGGEFSKPFFFFFFFFFCWRFLTCVSTKWAALLCHSATFDKRLPIFGSLLSLLPLIFFSGPWEKGHLRLLAGLAGLAFRFLSDFRRRPFFN